MKNKLIEEIKIRKANLKDLNQILEISKLLLDFHNDLDSYYTIYTKYEDHKKYYNDQLKKKNVIYFVAEINKEIVGLASGYIISIPKTKAPKIGVLVSNFVKDKFRNQGIGKKLLDARVEWFKKNGVTFLEMNVDTRNKKALSIWKKYGFKDYQIKLKKEI